MKDVIKKYLYESLRLWVVIGSFVFTYNEAWGVKIDGISYSVSGCTAKITACYSSKKEIVLPDSVDYNGKKYPVTEIAIQAFAQLSNLEKIKLPKSIISIGDKCFYYCTSLKSVTLSDSLATIGQSAFSGCSVLDSLTLPNSLTNIGHEAFSGCKGLGAIILPDSITWIGKYAFRGCTNLAYIRLPKNLRTIYEYAFADCSSLKKLEIPNGVETISEGCLLGCINLEELVIPFVGTSKNLKSPSRSSLFGILFGSTGRDSCTLTSQYYGKDSEIFYIPNKLSKVIVTGNSNLYYAFYGCSNIKEIVLRDISYIGPKSFYNCSGLTSLALPESLTTIESGAFFACSSLTSVKLPENLSEIGERAFYGCSSLKKLEIPSGIESIGNSCLDGCKSLEELVIPFIGTEKAPKSPSKNTLLGTLFGTRRYEGCIETQQYFKAGGNPQTLTFYIPEKLSRVTVTGNSNLYYAFYNCCNIKEIILSNTNFIGAKTFYGCSGLNNLILPDSLTTIGDSAFAGCSALKSIVLPESLTTIGSKAFQYCSALKSIVIPKKVSSIYQYAFSNCTGLKTVKLKTSRFLNNARTLGGIFENCVQEYVFDVDSLTTNAVYGISNLSRVTVGQSCTTIEKNALYRATIDTLWISKDIAYIGNQNVTVGHFFYQGSEADWNRVVNKSELEPDEYGIPRILERNGVKYGIESNHNNASVIKSPNTAKVYICSKIELAGEEFRIISIADNAFKDCTAIDTIFYEGNKVQWEKMIVGKHNDILQDIPIVYNNKKTEEDATLGDCYLYLNSCTLKKEKGQELAISMKNTKAITALQFELMLPDGFSVTQNTDGLYKVDISTDRSSSTQHDIVEVKKLAFDRYLILCSSTTNKTFAGNDGTAISLYIDVSENVTDGDYSFVLKNITLACDNGDVFRTNEIDASVVVRSDIRGDVNNDQEVNIGDISCIANIVLGDIADSYNLKAADVNLDGDINVGDVAYTAEYIINGSFPNTTYMRNLYMLPSNMPMLSFPNFEMQTDNDHRTTINLTSNGDITAFQFDMELPKGLRIKREFGKECIVQGKHISDSHILEWAQQESTDMRVIGYSLSNVAFNKGTENLISIELVADKDTMSGVYPIVLKNIVLATKTQTIKLYDQIVYVSVNQTTSINNIVNKSTTEDVFTIQGIKLQNRQRGINIINHKKVLIK